MVAKLSCILYITILCFHKHTDINDVFQLNYNKMNIVGLLESHNMVDWRSKDWVFLTQTLSSPQHW